MTDKPRKPLTFKEWKKALGPERTHDDPYLMAVSIVLNAHISIRNGEITPRGFKAAINWAYGLDYSGAYLEERRQKQRELEA